MQTLVEQAIREKKLVQFSYEGYPRTAEPHVLGRSSGVIQILVYQVGGSSSSGGIPGWRRFDLLKISDLSIRQEGFNGPRPFPSGKHSSWDYQIAIVKS